MTHTAPPATTAAADRTIAPAGIAARPSRWAVVDVARGCAIVAVVLFHLTWDLGDLGLISWRISEHESGKIIAHAIAGSFLLLVGVSLVLAHGRGIRWAAFWRREVQLLGLALLVTVASAGFDAHQLVTFGILHAIAVVSLIALPVVRAPRVVPGMLALAAVALPWIVQLPGRSAWVSWTGLADGTAPTLDWQPVLPWIALTFVGIAVMRPLVAAAGKVTTVASLRSWRPGPRPLRWVGVLGRHTLGIYVVHQPLMYGALWLLARSRS